MKMSPRTAWVYTPSRFRYSEGRMRGCRLQSEEDRGWGVSIDLDREGLDAVLASRGYSAGKRTLFIWEAATQLLTDAGVERALAFLAEAVSGIHTVEHLGY